MEEMVSQTFKRFRHRRIDEATRAKYRETTIDTTDFIWPVFLKKGEGVRQEIKSIPGVFRYSIDTFLIDLAELVKDGLKSILLFGVPDKKGVEQAWDENGIVQSAIPCIKECFPELEVITDVCLCSYTSDGHCHLGDNDITCEALAKVAVSHAKAGADIVAPSDMMDGRVWHIRQALDEKGLNTTKIMSYAAKFSSNYYGPFRDAADCTPQSGDRKTYQMDFANGKEALEEIEADLEEGADSIIVKPALAYLDIIARAKDRYDCPIIAYNVSGEYSMLINAVKQGFSREEIIMESLVSIKRAGASKIISYFVPSVFPLLKT